jgi:hypothetical protein
MAAPEQKTYNNPFVIFAIFTRLSFIFMARFRLVLGLGEELKN